MLVPPSISEVRSRRDLLRAANEPPALRDTQCTTPFSPSPALEAPPAPYFFGGAMGKLRHGGTPRGSRMQAGGERGLLTSPGSALGGEEEQKTPEKEGEGTRTGKHRSPAVGAPGGLRCRYPGGCLGPGAAPGGCLGPWARGNSDPGSQGCLGAGTGGLFFGAGARGRSGAGARCPGAAPGALRGGGSGLGVENKRKKGGGRGPGTASRGCCCCPGARGRPGARGCPGAGVPGCPGADVPKRPDARGCPGIDVPVPGGMSRCR